MLINKYETLNKLAEAANFMVAADLDEIRLYSHGDLIFRGDIDKCLQHVRGYLKAGKIFYCSGDDECLITGRCPRRPVCND